MQDGLEGKPIDVATGPSPRHASSDSDFFCLRFQVWYPTFDCALRTRFRTCPGCLDCEQGRFNLKRHHVAVNQPRMIRAFNVLTS